MKIDPTRRLQNTGLLIGGPCDGERHRDTLHDNLHVARVRKSGGFNAPEDTHIYRRMVIKVQDCDFVVWHFGEMSPDQVVAKLISGYQL